MKNIAVFCSGFGSNLQAIINAVGKGKIKAKIALVVGDRSDAYALSRAENAAIPILHVPSANFKDRTSYDKFVVRNLKQRKIDFVVLAGFMRLISPYFVRQFKNRMLNIHPSLLPAFKGTHGIRDALNYGAKVTGVTVHFVDEDLDHGPIISQGSVEIKAGDTEDSLAERIHKLEHKLYPEAVRLLVDGKLKVAGRRVKIQK